MILTSYFTTKKDWQRGKYVKPTFSKIQSLGRTPKSNCLIAQFPFAAMSQPELRKLYQTAVTNGLSVSVLYDVLPQEFLETLLQLSFND